MAVGGALAAFQALAIIAAPTASASPFTCTYVGGVLSVTSNVAETIGFQVSGDGTSRILVSTTQPPPVTATTIVACGATADATVANTTAINVVGDSTLAQKVVIYMSKGFVAPATSGNTTSWGTINWSLSLGSDTGDVLEVTNQGATIDPANSINVTLGANGIDLNSDANLDVTVSGVDSTYILGGAASDTIWGEGDTTTGGPYAGKMFVDGGDDNLITACTSFPGDTVSGGAADDVLSGGADTSACNEDFVDYSAATGPANISLTSGVAVAPGLGLDTVCNGDIPNCAAVAAPPVGTFSGDDGDASTFEDVGGSAFNDTINGDASDFGNDILPGAGDDTVDCVAGAGTDYIDESDSAAAVTVDESLGTATGNGNDTFKHCAGAIGSDFADTFIDDTTSYNEYFGEGGNDVMDQGTDPAVADGDYIDGGSGTDWVDYSQRTDDLKVDLSVPPLADSGSTDITPNEDDTLVHIENAALGSGDDVFIGNAFNNTVKPGGGANSLTGGGGGDTVDYSDYAAGVKVNLAGGGASQDAFPAPSTFVNVIGTSFNDGIVGNEFSNTIKSGKGNDGVTGGTGDDTLRLGPGNDTGRGGSGDDNLYGKKGNDTLFGGSGDDLGVGGPGKDRCKGIELARSCGTFKHPK